MGRPVKCRRICQTLKVDEFVPPGKKLKVGGGSYEVCPKASGCCRRQCEHAKCKSSVQE
ncbi:hypothetical protein [Faecalicatena contorta]|uniref:hypothetical protein n=1 Tax=Faecalicatena contorta TaxID=39482 RepID=UPI001565E096|nr:hypothetical protein [Faecalicatena contorta]